MTRLFLPAMILSAVLLTGCDSPKPKLAPSLPHGGTAFALPEGKGFVEVLRRETPEQPSQTQIMIYFFDAERNPLQSASTEATFTPKARRATPIPLKPTGDADPQKAGGLTSAPFPDPGEIVGMLSAKIENKPVSVAINIR